MVLADVNAKTIKINGTESLDSTGNFAAIGDSATIGSVDYVIGATQNDTASSPVVRFGSDQSDNSGALILEGKDGHTYRVFVNASGNLSTHQLV